MRNIKAFTLIELIVVILIVGILAAASIPLMRGRIESARWAEATAIAGTIRSAARVAFAEEEFTTGSLAMNNQDDRATLGFHENDLRGTYFDASNFSVSIDANGDTTVTVSAGEGVSGQGTLDRDGWSVSGN